MDNKTTFYVSRKNPLTWIMAACLVCSAVARIVLVCMEGVNSSAQLWSQILLPVGATLLYVAIALIAGQEQYHKTAVPIWFIAVFYGLEISSYGFNPLVTWLFWIALAFFCLCHTAIVSGWVRYAWLLLPLYASPLAVAAWIHRQLIYASVIGLFPRFLPGTLLFGGLLLGALAVRPHPIGEYHPTWGDRSDGRRIRTLPPNFQVSPYLMINRNESNNLFAESFEVTNLDRYIRRKRMEGMPSFGIMHVLVAAYVRCVAKYPALNRFVSGQKIYSRGNDIQLCMTVKKEMTIDSPDTTIKLHFHPSDTVVDVYNKFNAELEKVKATPLDSDFDMTAQIFTMIPGVLLKFVVWLLKLLDYFGLVPGFLLEVSPFHGSIYFTNLGSLGIAPVYHHLYDFGNLPIFCAFGCKRRVTEVLPDGTLVNRKYLDCTFNTDERTCDGYCYAAFFKYFRRLINNPQILELPPEEIHTDIP